MNTIAKFASFLVLALAAMNAVGAELAILRNGFEIRYDHRESMGDTTRLYLGPNRSAGYVDVATQDIATHEHDESVIAVAVTVPAAPAASAGKELKPIDVHAVVDNASKTHAIDPDLIVSMISAESSFNPRAVSPKGAQGLMQLMPGTAAKLGVKNSMDVEANVDGGTRYIRELLLRYNDDLVKALAAYNAGPHRVDQYHGVPPYRETRTYVSRIIRDFNRKKRAARHLAENNAARSHNTHNPAVKKAADVRPSGVHSSTGAGS